jgi:hypothetical protein
MTRFCNYHPAITAKFGQHLDQQKANGNHLAILKDFFCKVYHFSLFIHFKLILVTIAYSKVVMVNYGYT